MGKHVSKRFHVAKASILAIIYEAIMEIMSYEAAPQRFSSNTQGLRTPSLHLTMTGMIFMLFYPEISHQLLVDVDVLGESKWRYHKRTGGNLVFMILRLWGKLAFLRKTTGLN